MTTSVEDQILGQLAVLRMTSPRHRINWIKKVAAEISKKHKKYHPLILVALDHTGVDLTTEWQFETWAAGVDLQLNQCKEK